MLTVLWAATALAAGGAGEGVGSTVVLGGRCATASTALVRTEDGATIGLHHHLGAGGEGRGQPVLLVHGVSSNHRFFDLDADHGLGPGWRRAAGMRGSSTCAGTAARAATSTARSR